MASVPPSQRGSASSLHEQVAQTIRRRLLRRESPGTKLPSEARLAQQLNVSVLTLRQALSVLAHEGLIERRHGSGTYVADPRHHQVVAIGTATYPGQNLNSFQMRLFVHLCELFQRAGYRCRSYLSPVGLADGWAELRADMRRGWIAGAAFVGMDARSVGIPLAAHRVPCVGTGPPYSVYVVLDHTDLIRSGVRQLWQQGCRRIALMEWISELPHQPEVDAVFRSAMAEHGLPIRQEWIHRAVHPNSPGAGWEQFREIWSAREEKPDGLLVTDDILFRDVAMAILNSRIRVPDQLKVVVHANKGSNVIYPFPVSLLEVDLREWAETLMRQLIELMNHEPVASPISTIRARMIPATTTGELSLVTARAPATTGRRSRGQP